MTIFLNDAKTSVRGKFPRPSTTIPIAWGPYLRDALSRLDLGDEALEREVLNAFRVGRVFLRQINVDYSPSGQGRIDGL